MQEEPRRIYPTLTFQSSAWIILVETDCTASKQLFLLRYSNTEDMSKAAGITILRNTTSKGHISQRAVK